MTNLLVLIFLLSLFDLKGIFLWFIYLFIKAHWPAIKEYFRTGRFQTIIDMDKFKIRPKFERSFSSSSSFNFPSMGSLSFKSVVKILVGLFIFFMLFDGFTLVPAGHVGVIFDRGRGVLPEAFPEGLHLKIPFWQSVEKLDARTIEYTMTAVATEGGEYGDDSMTAPTADGQTVTVDATILFHIDMAQAPKLYQTVGSDYLYKIVRPAARSQIRMVISRYTAIDIYSEKRAEAEQAMNADISKILAEKGILLERVLLRNVTFSPEYAKSIEEKQIAQQRIQKADYERQEAEKLKQKKIVEAEAEAQAIKLKGEMLRSNPQVIQFEFVQKMAPNIHWGVLPDNILPLVDLKKLSGE